MESYPQNNFRDVKSKNTFKKALHLTKRAEAEAMPKTNQGCGPSTLEQGNLKNLREETHDQNLANEGENNNSSTIDIGTSLSTNPSQGTSTDEPITSPQESIQPNNNSTSINPTTLKAKSILLLGFTALIGLLSVPYKINGNGNIVPTVLFHQSADTFSVFLIIFMIIFFFAAIGLVLEEPCPKISKVFNIISSVFLVLGATVLLSALIPKNIRWIPWIFFACTAAVVFGVLVLKRFTDKRAASKSTAPRPPV